MMGPPCGGTSWGRVKLNGSAWGIGAGSSCATPTPAPVNHQAVKSSSPFFMGALRTFGAHLLLQWFPFLGNTASNGADHEDTRRFLSSCIHIIGSRAGRLGLLAC